MSFSSWFSRRMKLRGAASSSTGVTIAVVGVALALMVMELSLAVVNGFKHQIERKVIGFDAPISILPPYDYDLGEYGSEMTLTDSLSSVLYSIIPTDSRLVERAGRQAIIKTDSDFIAVQFVAFGRGHDYDFENSNLLRGTMPAGGDSIAISQSMARQLKADTADRVFLYFFADGQPKVRRATVSGIYNSNFGEYDQTIAYCPLPLLQGISNDQSAVNSIGVEGIESLGIEGIMKESQTLQSRLLDLYRLGQIDGVYPVVNVVQKGAMYFSWLDLLDTNVVVILILMSCVAAFTLISSLFILILDRIPTIGILLSLGASKSMVVNIFLSAALRIVGLGMLIGNAIALSIIGIQNASHILPLNPEMYYLDSVPFEISWVQLLTLNGAAIVGAWLILILPARLAASVDPASTMRYE